jgi:hypothetical protein
MTDAERQAHRRAARAAGVQVIRTRWASAIVNRAKRWRGAVTELIMLQSQSPDLRRFRAVCQIAPLLSHCPQTRAKTPCRAPAMKNHRRCRPHGGLSTGPRIPEARARIRAAQTTHGLRTAAMEQMRRPVRGLRAGAKRLAELT